MSRSDVYLVSAKQHDNEKSGHENPNFETESSFGYNSSNGLDNAESNKKMPDRPYRGMGKDELLHFSSRPFWKRLRMACIAIVLIGWLALIITVVALVLVYPRCREPATRSWWQKETVYRIYVPSFKDSDDDGIGDLAGVESKLEYIQDLGFGVISLSPFYSGDSTGTGVTLAQFRAGNDMSITDHKSVGDVYGTLADFDSLVAAAHAKGMHVVLDFVPNHTSKNHPWFVASSGSSTGTERNFYMWAGSGASEPNNWKSHYGDSGWTNDTSGRGEWYLHQFAPDTADLNLRSALVRQELEGILTFWLDREVDGFNVRDTASLFEDFDLRDDPLAPFAVATSNVYSDYEHIYSSNQPEVFGLLEQWRIVARSNNKTHTDKLLMADTDGGLDVERLYSYCTSSGVQMPLNRHSVSMQATCDSQCITKYVDDWMTKVPSGKWANWLSGDEDSSRFASRFNSSFVEAFTILTYLLPGTPLTYCGDEVGLRNAGLGATGAWSRDQTSRAIMPWSDDGFCNNCTKWTQVGDVHPDSGALSGLIKDLTLLRQEPSFVIGDYAKALRNENVFSFVREFDGETGYLVAINFGQSTVQADVEGSHGTIQSDGVVVLQHGTPYAIDDEVDLTALEIKPHGGIVVSWDYVAKEL